VRSILEKLAGGDRRSIGRSNQVVKQVLARPDKFSQLFAGLGNKDYLVRMRAADAIEKITLQRPVLLQPYKRQLLELAGQLSEKEVRWHMAQILPRLELSVRHRAAALDILFEYLRDTSSIVKTFAMQAIADFAAEEKALAVKVLPMILQLTETGTPAMRARGRRILRRWTPQAASRKRRALCQK
jgi:HEAT repeat protein